ncbi:zinc-ribbon domain-containing protein [Paracoccus sp. (in: a-proteobacteria)]|uniref:zinc-ribbon domain-containing protein n=1 Tax=Paracoccus sp. TaxID=267 RepID=UPI003A85D780
MAELRLICPECGTQYRLPDNAIPSSGREVECTACGKVWWATRPLPYLPPSPQPPAKPQVSPTEAGDEQEYPDEPADDAAQISRRLPDNVLRILRDEVEHERRARAAENDVTAPLPPDEDPDWPATTLTGQEPGRPPLADDPARPDTVEPVAPQQNEPDQPPPVLTARPPDAPISVPVPTPVPPHEAEERPQSQPPGYGMGFGVAAMVAALALVLYLLAPGLAGTGPVGDGLMQYRQQVDAGRSWLARVTGHSGTPGE